MAFQLNDLLGLFANLPAFFGLIDNIAFVMICLFLGSFAVNGWKRYKNYAIKIIGSLSLGFVCLFGSIMLEPLIPFKLPFLSGAIPALITAVMLYIILLLLSGSATAATKYVKTESYEELMDKFNNLVDEVKRLKSILKRKGVVPTELSLKELEKSLNEILKTREITRFRVMSKKHEEDLMKFVVKSGKSEYKASLDAYTGELMSFEQTNPTIKQRVIGGLKFLANNKRVLAGMIIAVIFTSFMLSQLDDETISEFNQRIQFTVEGVQSSQSSSLFLNYTINQEQCLTVTDLLYASNEGLLEKLSSTNESYPNIESSISTYSPEFIYPLFYDYEGSDYTLLLLSNINQEDFMSALIGDNPLSLLMGSGSVNLCEINHNNNPLSDYLTVCTANLNNDELCACALMSDLGDYCSIASGIITSSLISEGMSMIG